MAIPHARVAMLRTTLKAEWKPAGYPYVLKHLGDHLRKRRLDLGLEQKAVAVRLAADAASIGNWEAGRTTPATRYVAAILTFLGYDPRPVPADLAGRLIHHRVGRGMSQEAFARLLGVDPGTLRGWESARQQPRGDYLTTVNAALNAPSRS